MRLSQKVSLVTGAATGINKAIAMAFGREGALVICADRDLVGAAATAAAIRDLGGASQEIACDVTCDADIEAAVDLAGSLGGGPDVLVNGAGIMQAQPVLEISRESFQAVFDVNVIGLFLMLQAGARAMIAAGRKGRIINLASIAGRQGNAGSLQYCASKAAVISITQSAGQALAVHGITVNAIAPGFIQTNMWGEVQTLAGRVPNPLTPDQFDTQLASTVAAGRLGHPSDIVGAALFLASDDARYIVGQTINVDGGVEFN